MRKSPIRILVFSLLVLIGALPGNLKAQSLASVSTDHKETTAYPSYPVNDPIYYFCTQEGVNAGSLTAKSTGTSVSFLWEKFDQVSLKFLNFSNETATTSTLNRLADGCYRVTFSENGTNYQFRAWVLNGWSKPVASVAVLCTSITTCRPGKPFR